MKVFWILFGLDLWMGAGVVFNVVLTLVDGEQDAGSVLWRLILSCGFIALLSGSLRLKARNRMRTACALLMAVALLPVLAVLTFMVLLVTATNFR